MISDDATSSEKIRGRLGLQTSNEPCYACSKAYCACYNIMNMSNDRFKFLEKYDVAYCDRSRLNACSRGVEEQWVWINGGIMVSRGT